MNIRIREFLRRPLCYLIGCRCEHPQGCSCDRCGAHLYEGWVQISLCDPLFRWWWAFTSRLKPRRCDHCGRRLGYRNIDPLGINFCSPEREEHWIPF